MVLRHARGTKVLREIFDSDFRLLARRETTAGTVERISADLRSTQLIVIREGLRDPPERLTFDPRTSQETRIAAAPVDFDPSRYAIDSAEVASKDGTLVPITVLRRADVPRDGAAPLWIYGYGGFAVSAEQVFFAPWAAWAQRGGVFALCHTRGGLEYGEPWHEAGSRRNRQKTIDDFVACTEELHRRRYSAPARTMIQGWSHGGMLVSAVATQRPELQRFVLATVPLTDMIRFPLFGRGGVSEYGDPDDRDDFTALHSFSPYHRVRRGVRYPSFLVTASTNDERVVPMHAAKVTAALQDASAGGEVLLKVNWGAGHHGGGKEDANRVFAEAAAYAMKALEL